MTDLYAVMGDPIEHSLSPTIHRLFAKQTGQDMAYTKRHVLAVDFTKAVDDFFKQGGKGLNITVPHKQSAYQLADGLSERAQLAGAVNTLLLDERGRLYGDNTDGVGLLRDLGDNFKLVIKDARVLLLGASGAARGVVGPLLGEGVARLHVANRTASRAQELVSTFENDKLSASGLVNIKESFDIIINATAASLQGESPAVEPALYREAFCYDMMYAKQPTAFMREAVRQGARDATDGLGMLVEQAAEAFFLWRRCRPKTKPVLDTLQHLS